MWADVAIHASTSSAQLDVSPARQQASSCDCLASDRKRKLVFVQMEKQTGSTTSCCFLQRCPNWLHQVFFFPTFATAIKARIEKKVPEVKVSQNTQRSIPKLPYWGEIQAFCIVLYYSAIFFSALSKQALEHSQFTRFFFRTLVAIVTTKLCFCLYCLIPIAATSPSYRSRPPEVKQCSISSFFNFYTCAFWASNGIEDETQLSLFTTGEIHCSTQ